ncbi:hypothetical protein [Pseudochrobactrum saccharolyticum]|nr:hypothetical protein [Pseudochrobactrum saccharolyticum]MDP8250210.1 hypothetical protein [Pseudochrobactrum saccharolyticum]
MPFKFQIKNASTSKFLHPQISNLANTYITYSIKGTPTDNTNNLIWVTTADPKPSSSTSAGMRFYNPECNIYLGDTEQPANSALASGAVASISGTVAGAPDFTTPGIVSKWFLQTAGSGQYRIFIHDNDTNNVRKLMMDVNNDYRVIITTDTRPPTASISDLWTIEYI